MYTTAGGSSVYSRNLLERGFRDVHTAGAELAKPRKKSRTTAITSLPSPRV